MKNNFNFCPHCAGNNIRNINMRKWQCDDCGFVLYNNAAASVAVIIPDNMGQVLFEVRAKEPQKGMLCLPGGFVEHNETLEQACVRECVEEIGVKPLTLKYLTSFANTYEYNGIVYKTCDSFFVAELAQDTEFYLQKNEVSGIKKFFVKNSSDIAKLPLAFESARNALEFYIKNK